jgi:hypothetical protein
MPTGGATDGEAVEAEAKGIALKADSGQRTADNAMKHKA